MRSKTTTLSTEHMSSFTTALSLRNQIETEVTDPGRNLAEDASGQQGKFKRTKNALTKTKCHFGCDKSVFHNCCVDVSMFEKTAKKQLVFIDFENA